MLRGRSGMAAGCPAARSATLPTGLIAKPSAAAALNLRFATGPLPALVGPPPKLPKLAGRARPTKPGLPAKFITGPTALGAKPPAPPTPPARRAAGAEPTRAGANECAGAGWWTGAGRWTAGAW